MTQIYRRKKPLRGDLFSFGNRSPRSSIDDAFHNETIFLHGRISEYQTADIGLPLQAQAKCWPHPLRRRTPESCSQSSYKNSANSRSSLYKNFIETADATLSTSD
jgi:hypothetical protein